MIPVLILLTSVIIAPTSAQTIAINEVMASNATTIADEDGDFEDWIELYNYGTEPVNLAGYGLSDSYNNPFKWVLPEIIIQPGEFLMIWASGKNRSTPGSPLHTNYSISASGEELLLTRPDSTLLNELIPTAIPTDISYGRFPDGTGTWFFFSEPTPGSINNTQTYNEVLAPPVFSHPGGFYSDSFELGINHPDPDVTIVYTLDGSIPDLQSLSGTNYQYKNSYPQNPGQPLGSFLTQTFCSYVYQSPFLVYNRSQEANKLSKISSTYHFNPTYFPSSPVIKGTSVNAIAIKEGSISSLIETNTFFINGIDSNFFTLPVISLTTQENFLFDYHEGIYIAGEDFDNWRTANPAAPVSGMGPANYWRQGAEWEYPAHVEFFDISSNTASLKQNLGLRIHGAWSRSYPLKSFRLYARNSYGNPQIDYPFFNNLVLSSFKRLILRNSGNDFDKTFFRDAAIQTIVRHLNFDTQSYLPVVLFINGEYWGLINIRERYDNYYLASKYGVNPDSLDILSGNAVVVQGSSQHYIAMRNFMTQNDLSNDQHYEYVRTQMDVESFADYFITGAFIRNTDWPHNNIDYWRLKTNQYKPNAPYGHDGRWRWMLYDSDHGFGLSSQFGDSISFNMMAFITNPNGNDRLPNAPWINRLLVNLLKNQNFRLLFINRFADQLNTTFLPGRMIDIINGLKSNIEPEMPSHIHRWKSPSSMAAWHNHVNVMINFANQRPFYQRQHIREHFDIESELDVTLNVNDSEAGHIRINTITITPDTPGVPEEPYPWTGIYFHNIPIEVEAIAKPGYVFSHWTGSAAGNDAVLGLTPTGNISLTAHFIEQQTPEPEIVHYWHFNNLPSGTLIPVSSDYSVNTTGTITYPGTGPGYMDRRTHNPPNDPVSNLNLLMGQQPNQGSVLRVRNPSVTRELIITASTAGYEQITVNFATARTSSGAQGQEFYYSTNGGLNWTLHAAYSVIQLTAWELKTFDLTGIPEVNDNEELMFKILFTGSNASLSDGNNRFDNFSVHGISTNIPLEYYSKPTGPLYALSTWGSEADGSGTAPTSFANDETTFFIHNREETVLENNWTVSGLGSRIVVGNGIQPTHLQLNASLDALVDISANAGLTLTVEDYPAFGLLDENSTIVFKDGAQHIPFFTYHHLVFDDINPVFTGNGTITVQGNMTLLGGVNMPDARGASQYSFSFSGNAVQLINTNNNVLRSYDMGFVKTSGSIAFTSGSIISTDNQFTLNIGSQATFTDNGITIYAGNSVNIAGNPEFYVFTGTLILAGTEPGIVKGSGAGNNFNLRLSEASNTNMAATLNNVIVRVANTGGEFRFRDGSTNTFTIKGDFVVEPGADGRIRFYNNDVFIGGDFIIQEGFTGTLDPVKSITFNGVNQQVVAIPTALNLQKLTCSNPGGLNIYNPVNITGMLEFVSGIIRLSGNGNVSLALNASAAGYDSNKFIDGSLSITVDNTESEELFFPVGLSGSYLPVLLVVAHAESSPVIYSVRVEPFNFSDSSPEEELEYLMEDYMYELGSQGNAITTETTLILTFDEQSLGFNPDFLRIAKLENGTWINLGGTVSGNNITTAQNFELPAVFALAKAADIPEVPEMLLLQDIFIASGSDTCFAAAATIIVAGGESFFTLQQNADLRLVAGSKIRLLSGTSIQAGSWLWAYIDESGNYCTQQVSLVADKSNSFLNYMPDNQHIKHDTLAFRLYPNPTGGLLVFEASQDLNYGSEVEIFNIQGRVVLQHVLGSEAMVLFDLSSLPPGVYLVKLNAGKGITTRKIIKM